MAVKPARFIGAGGVEETRNRIGAGGSHHRAQKLALEARLAEEGDIPLSVGRSSVPTEPVLAGVAVVRYVTLMVCMGILALGGALGLGWGLIPALLLFGIGASGGLVLIALIETRQVVAVLNSILDYWLMASNLDDTQDLRRLLLERTLDMDEAELRHRNMMERQLFWSNNQHRMLDAVRGTSAEDSAKRALASSALQEASMVDSMIEDYLAQSMKAFTVTLLDRDESGRMTSVDARNGRVTVRVPWAASSESMGDEEKALAIGILSRIGRDGPPMFLEDEGQWFFNLDCYPKPIDVVRAFDTAYGA